MSSSVKNLVTNLRSDFSASIVVFLVALPLCLGVALASGAPMFAGIIAGLVGGLIVSWASGSQLSVSGPAAGLTVIVFNAIESLGGYGGFLFSLMLAGGLQVLLGFLKAGVIGAFFPASVVNGMLAAIGIILILKQLPHAMGFDVSFEGDESYMRENAESSFFELVRAIEGLNPGVTLVSVVALLILIFWECRFIKRFSLLRLIPGPLLAVAWGICYNSFAVHLMPEWVIGEKHLVSLPVLGNAASFIDQLRLPDFNQFSNPKAYGVAVTIAIIASLESLLSIEAVDKLDPQKRIAPANRELKAQGIGNFISGLVGGLPITAVIVRSSANINAGGKTRLACFFHGVLLLISVLFFSTSLNTIPLACLAAILLHTGYKLASPRLFVAFYQRGWNQFLPFLITVLAILLADLLAGIAIGMLFGFFFVLKANFHAAITLTQHGSNYLLRLHKDVSFLNKALLRKYLQDVPENSDLWIDGSKAQFIDDDILDAIADFMLTALNRNINVELQDIAMPVRSNISH